MINPRLLAMAKRHMNSGIPRSLDNLVSQDSKGKPKLNLTPMERTAISTIDQEDYDQLIRVYECGGWKWNYGRNLPTEEDYWKRKGKKTYVEAGVFHYSDGTFDKRKFGISDQEFFQENSYEFLSTSDFYEKQNPPITEKMISEINSWFEQNDK